MVDTVQYLCIFLEESMQKLQTINQLLVELEENPDDLDTINNTLNNISSIKDMARTIGFIKMVELASKIEKVFLTKTDKKASIQESFITVVRNALEILETMVVCIEEGVEYDDEIGEISKALDSLVASTHNYEIVEENEFHSVDLNKIDDMVSMVSELANYKSKLKSLVMNNRTQELEEILVCVDNTSSSLKELLAKVKMTILN